MTSGLTERDRAKADRQAAILREAARLFAERGFSGVSLEDLGGAVGVSGPAVYRHFANKQALLGAILLQVSEKLLSGGRDVLAREEDPGVRLAALVAFHVDFALHDADVIRVQDRDLASLRDEDRNRVRRLQREYVELWIQVLAQLHPDADGVRPPHPRPRVLRPDELDAAQPARRPGCRRPTVRRARCSSRWRSRRSPAERRQAEHLTS